MSGGQCLVSIVIFILSHHIHNQQQVLNPLLMKSPKIMMQLGGGLEGWPSLRREFQRVSVCICSMTWQWPTSPHLPCLLKQGKSTQSIFTNSAALYQVNRRKRSLMQRIWIYVKSSSLLRYFSFLLPSPNPKFDSEARFCCLCNLELKQRPEMVLREAMDISSLLFIVANLSLSELKLLWFDDLSFTPPFPQMHLSRW